jgi:hypothetical protein
MSPSRHAAGRARAARVIVALVAVSTCLGAVAYGATHSAGLEENKPISHDSQVGGGKGGEKGEEKLPRARFIEVPEPASTVAGAQFRFNVPARAPEAGSAPPARPPAGEAPPLRRFQCRLDEGAWSGCESPARLAGLALGEHSFAVRALTRSNRPGPVVSYSWRRLAEPVAEEGPTTAQPFSIESTGRVEGLIPGDPARQLPIEIRNPNSVAIEVTDLTVAIASDPPGCPANENFELTPSSASPSAPLTVPGGATVALPTATVTAPTIAMPNLPVNQDACRGAELELLFSGEARG